MLQEPMMETGSCSCAFNPSTMPSFWFTRPVTYASRRAHLLSVIASVHHRRARKTKTSSGFSPYELIGSGSGRGAEHKFLMGICE